MSLAAKQRSSLGPALLALSLLDAPAGGAQETAVRVTNDRHEVEIVRAERHDALMNGMLRPEDPSQAFLLVFVDTDDPCLDPARLEGCFEEIPVDEKLAWACGWLVLADGEERLADGGGVLDGELACSYVVPRSSKRLTLVMRGYPEVELEPTLSAQAD